MAKLTREDVERIVTEAREKGERPDLRGLTLKWMELICADLTEANLRGTNLRGTNLRGTNLIETNLSRANLSKVELTEANLSKANLRGAFLGEANLNEANLSGANLSQANLSRANLNEANLRGAYLSRADLSGANLSGANLSGSDLSGTALSDLDLRQVKGLEIVNHRGPSPISISTVQLSQGQIPEVFLRGCGLSDWEIENAKLYNPHLTEYQITDITYKIHNLLTGPAIKYKSCFISYSSKDQAFAERIYTDLQESGVRCWFAPEDMKIGDKIRHSIDQAIRLQDKLLLVLSEPSIESQWVESEVERAFALECRRKETVLFPIRVDNTVMMTDVAWASEVKETRHIGDFCQWQDETAYQISFQRLLEDLRTEG